MCESIKIENETWLRLGDKKGGTKPAGKYGGIYQSGDTKALIKRDFVPRDIAEFIGAKFHNKAVPDNSPEMFISRIPYSDSQFTEDGSDVYLGSVYFDNYKDLFKDIFKQAGLEEPKDRPSILSSFWHSDIFVEGLKNNGYVGFPQVTATSLLIGDFDVHWGNIGVIRTEDMPPKLVRVDFGSSFNNLYKEINPHSILQHLPVFGPLNHFIDFPIEMKLNKEFTNELKRVSKIDFNETIEESFNELKKVYSEDVIKGFGERLGIKFYKEHAIDVSETIQNKLKTLISERQISLKNYATELEIDLCIDQNETTNYWELDEDEFEGIIEENPEYFKDVSEGKKAIEFWDLKHKDTWNPLIYSLKSYSFTKVFTSIAHFVNKILLETIYFPIPTTELKLTNMVNASYSKSINKFMNHSLKSDYIEEEGNYYGQVYSYQTEIKTNLIGEGEGFYELL